jgi:hypothetical protein
MVRMSATVASLESVKVSYVMEWAGVPTLIALAIAFLPSKVLYYGLGDRFDDVQR